LSHNVNTGLDKLDFKEEFPGASRKLLKLVSNMLEFNPYFRATPLKLLKSKIFAKIRTPSLEEPS